MRRVHVLLTVLCLSQSTVARADEERARTTGRLAGDAAAKALAAELFDATGAVVTVAPAHVMDGGFRGVIQLVPELPVGPHRKHLAYVTTALRDIDATLRAVRAGSAAGGPKVEPRYRHRDLTFAFFRSVGRTTPSAYASGWTVSYNVSGSLHRDADAVRETVFHEIFHLNDFDHGDWAARTLAADYAAILERCGAKTACLAPYAPASTVVRGGTFYAFQGNNGMSVREYGAELASRWYRENRAMLRKEPLPQPSFKCGPPENARAWAALVDEFFGVDLTPPCSGR